MTDPCLLGALDLARAVAAGQLSPIEVTESLLQRIAHPKLHAYIEVYGANARLAAEGAAKSIRANHSVGPLHGVPIALKDLIELEGHITTGGSPAKRRRRSKITATVAKRLMAQGMIILGKTHTVEFALGGWGTNQHMGTPWNPWDACEPRTPGGSSSGSAVAIAARMAPWAVGTDTGGSVRLPAAFCGLTALKATIGRISTYGIIPLSSSLDTPGPMARSVEDVALLFTALQGSDPLDPSTRGIPPADPSPIMGRGVRGLRLARMPSAERGGVAPSVLAAYDRSIEVLAALGAEIVDITLPFTFSDLLAANAITYAEGYYFNGRLAEDTAVQIDESVRKRILAGREISAQEYLKTKFLQRELKQAFDTEMEEIDALLTPTTETAALLLRDVNEEQAPSRFTRFVNLLELCALALPNGFDEAGLPLSLQIVCRGYDEVMALRIGHCYQQATDWHRPLPPIA